MEKNTGFDVAGAGFVRSVFSRRQQAQAVPFDLLLAHCRAVRLAAARRRVAGAFAGYLVTEPVLDVWRDDGGRVVLLGAVDVTGAAFFLGEVLRRGFEYGGLDSPYALPAGGVRKYLANDGEVCAAAMISFREGWWS